MAEVEIGIGKSARRAYGFDEVAIVPSRRTRDSADVDISWQIDAFRFGLPILASPCDSVVSPGTADALGGLGGLGVLHLEGIWTRYADPGPVFEEIAGLVDDKATGRLQEIYAEPVKPDLVEQRIADLRRSGHTVAVAVTPQHTSELAPHVLRAEPDLLVIQGTVVSAEHVSRRTEPLNLKDFIRHYEIPVVVGGCTSYQAALHLMRTGAAGVLVGAGSGAAGTTRRVLGVGVPMATAIADARAARMRHLDETGVYVHVIADGGMTTGGDIAKAIVCGADAVMVGTPLAAAVEAPGRGFHWGMTSVHRSLPRGNRVPVEIRGTLEEILLGPAHEADGRRNLVGGLRRAMALCGYESLKDFQKADLAVLS
ncbi:MAG: GuaB3 family IMP dehydrogenase-related protein [Acidimicrobiia bacterium]